MSMTSKFCYQHIAKVSQSNIPDYTNSPTFPWVCAFSVTFAKFPDICRFQKFQKSGNPGYNLLYKYILLIKFICKLSDVFYSSHRCPCSVFIYVFQNEPFRNSRCRFSIDWIPLEARIQIGWNKFRQLVPLLTNRDISLIRRGREGIMSHINCVYWDEEKQNPADVCTDLCCLQAQPEIFLARIVRQD